MFCLYFGCNPRTDKNTYCVVGLGQNHRPHKMVSNLITSHCCGFFSFPFRTNGDVWKWGIPKNCQKMIRNMLITCDNLIKLPFSTIPFPWFWFLQNGAYKVGTHNEIAKLANITFMKDTYIYIYVITIVFLGFIHPKNNDWVVLKSHSIPLPPIQSQYLSPITSH